jgi:hypothetical protein
MRIAPLGRLSSPQQGRNKFPSFGGVRGGLLWLEQSFMLQYHPMFKLPHGNAAFGERRLPKIAPLGRKYFLQNVNGYNYSKFDKGTSPSFSISSRDKNKKIDSYQYRRIGKVIDFIRVNTHNTVNKSFCLKRHSQHYRGTLP